MDVEGNNAAQQQRKPGVDNPYSNLPPLLPHWHPINILQRCFYMGVALYGLFYFNTYDKLMKSPDIRHEWFQIGLAATAAIVLIKAYVEMYVGKVMKQKVNYETFPQTTHTVIVLILVSSLAYHLALWPVYGSLSMLIMFLVGAFLLNFCLIFPTYVQNIAAFAILTFFIQEYK